MDGMSAAIGYPWYPDGGPTDEQREITVRRAERTTQPPLLIEPCHEPCLEERVAQTLDAANPHYGDMVREHYRRRREYVEIVLPRNQRHRQKWRQQYGTDPSPPNTRPYPEDDYACRFSGFAGDGAALIRHQEGLIRTGLAVLVCLKAEREEGAA